MELTSWVPEPPSIALFDAIADFWHLVQKWIFAAWWSGFAWGAVSVLLALIGLVLGVSASQAEPQGDLVPKKQPAVAAALRVSLVLPSGTTVSVPE